MRSVLVERERFHQIVRGVVEAKRAGNRADAEAGLEKVRPLSETVVALLEELERSDGS
jgi:hypothetical protein